MGKVIFVDFVARSKTMSLEQARVVLEEELYQLAMGVWSLEELERTVNHPQCFAEVYDAYNAVYRFRTQDTRPPCEVITLFPERKAA